MFTGDNKEQDSLEKYNCGHIFQEIWSLLLSSLEKSSKWEK